MKTTPVTIDEDASEAADNAFLESTTSKFISTSKVHHPEFPLNKVIFDPAENYRWGSVEAMNRDIGEMDTPESDGTPSSYQLVKSSISISGVHDAIELVEREDGFHVVSGFTRTKIALDLGLKTIPAFVYSDTLSNAEFQLLQVQENAKELHRDVNWVQELQTYNGLIALYTNVKDPETGEFMTHRDAALLLQKIMGKHPSTMKSRNHWYKLANKRIQKLAFDGVISCSCLQVFLTADKSDPYTDSFIVEVLNYLKTDGVLPKVITPENARRAIRNLKIKSANSITDEDGNRISKSKGKTPAKIRQSPAILRDATMAMARALLVNEKLSIDSSEGRIEELLVSYEHAMFVGMGMGAGDVALPPVLEQVLGGKGDDDEFVSKMNAQHLRTAEIYAYAAFIHGFIQLALDARGIKNLGLAGEGGWLSKESIVDGERVQHRALYFGSVREAAEHVSEGMSFKARVLMAWEPIKKAIRG